MIYSRYMPDPATLTGEALCAALRAMNPTGWGMLACLVNGDAIVDIDRRPPDAEDRERAAKILELLLEHWRDECVVDQAGKGRPELARLKTLGRFMEATRRGMEVVRERRRTGERVVDADEALDRELAACEERDVAEVEARVRAYDALVVAWEGCP